MKITKWTLLSVLSAAAMIGTMTPQSFAEVKLTKAFTDNAVLQRDVPVCVWGTADAGEKVTVSFSGNSVETTACDTGCWKVQLPAMPGTFEGKDLTVKGATNEIVLKNVVVGEVWICSGQSNMEQPLNSWGQPRLSCSEEEFTGDYSFIRFNRIRHELKAEDSLNVNSDGWQMCKDNVQKNCTACGFHFAVKLSKELNVPIGLIDSNWGGSNINSWIPDEGWNNVPETVEPGKKLIEQRTADLAAGKACGRGHAGGMYYAMLSPWKNCTVKGVIWYQGCSNAGEGEFYYFKQKAMILEWRKIWGDVPFYWVQLANFRANEADPNSAGWGFVRNGQTMCMEVPKTGQAVAIDIGEEKDIHPRNKWDVGNRLARWALANDYGKEGIVFCSPMMESVTIDGAKAVVKFNNVGSGLVVAKNVERKGIECVEGTPNCFAVAGEDKNFKWAKAEIVGKDTVVLTCEEVPAPKFVRFAFQNNPKDFNLYSKEGLPATPFHTEK
ncbi:MAG: hypothetical protein J6J31_15155 [Thermoguttaceae bacterium]|nr:hypothetical protein [Thermoguttaceae bacterium]